jgi:hypothetical protein
MLDRGFFLTWQAVRRQLAAMPHDLYLVRLIHHATHTAFPGERLWSAAQLTTPATIRLARAGTRATFCSISTHPTLPFWRRCAGMDSSLALCCKPALATCKPGCTSAPQPLLPALATAVAKRLARIYHGDPASADWRHLGRLAGFTNQKPARRTRRGQPPLGQASPQLRRLAFPRAALAGVDSVFLGPSTVCICPDLSRICPAISWTLQ